MALLWLVGCGLVAVGADMPYVGYAPDVELLYAVWASML